MSPSRPDTNYNAASSNTLVIQVVTSNVWVANGNGTVTGLSNTGTAVTASAQTGGGTAIAIDNAGDVWSLNKTGSKVSEYSSAGILISGGTTVGGLNLPTSLAIDGAGLVWVTNGGSVGTLSVLSAPGTRSLSLWLLRPALVAHVHQHRRIRQSLDHQLGR